MRTRTNLIEMANTCMDFYKTTGTKTRLNTCQAWYFKGCEAGTHISKPLGYYTVLQSYETAVALYRHETGTLYVFDFYSNTTTQHVYKFAKVMDANRIVFLYRRSDGIIEKGLKWFVDDVKLTTKEFIREEVYDFSLFC